MDAGIEGDELPHEDNIKKVPINGPVDEFLIAETKDRDVEKKSIVSLMDCVEDSKKHEGLMVSWKLNEAQDPFVLKINSCSLVIGCGSNVREQSLGTVMNIERSKDVTS